jgi:hypothetical protein
VELLAKLPRFEGALVSGSLLFHHDLSTSSFTDEEKTFRAEIFLLP